MSKLESGHDGDMYEAIRYFVHQMRVNEDWEQHGFGNRLQGFYESLVAEGLKDQKFKKGINQEVDQEVEYVFRDGKIEHYAERHTVSVGVEVCQLKPITNALLLILTNPPGVLHPYHEIIANIWEDSDVEDANDNLRVNIRNLRKVLSSTPEKCNPISVVRGAGYIYEPYGEYARMGTPPHIRPSGTWSRVEFVKSRPGML